MNQENQESEQSNNEATNVQGKGSLRIFDVLVPEESGSGKTYWKAVGVVFKRENADGMTMRLFMHPGVNFVVREKSSSVAKAEERKAVEHIPF